MINILMIADKQFLVDMGFGGSKAPTHPITLISDPPSLTIGPSSLRHLLFAPIGARITYCRGVSNLVMEKLGPGSTGALSRRPISFRKILR